MDSEIKTDLEILKKIVFGNGVKGAVTRIEELEDKLDHLEIYMEKSFNEKVQQIMDKIEERKKFNLGQALVVLAILADLAMNIVS